ncbi:hypothetical protein ACFL1T_03505 [Chlamydiota bacterium]
MKQLFMLVIILLLSALTVYLFKVFFSSAKTIKEVKSTTDSVSYSGSGRAYLNPISRAKTLKKQEERRQQNYTMPNRTSFETIQIKRSSSPAHRQEEKEEWYRNAIKKQQTK